MNTLVKVWMYSLLAGILYAGMAPPVQADVSSALQTMCANVDCLTNFTGKTGWSLIKKQEFSGGFTDFESSWYVSPVLGFDVPIGAGVSVQTPFIDPGIDVKLGRFLTSQIPYLKTLTTAQPFVSGLLGALTIGESVGYIPSTVSGSKVFDISWIGATFSFGGPSNTPASNQSVATTPPVDPSTN